MSWGDELGWAGVGLGRAGAAPRRAAPGCPGRAPRTSEPISFRKAITFALSRSTIVAPSSISSFLVRSKPSSSGTRLTVRILSILHSWISACPVGRSAQFWMIVSPGLTLP